MEWLLGGTLAGPLGGGMADSRVACHMQRCLGGSMYGGQQQLPRHRTQPPHRYDRRPRTFLSPLLAEMLGPSHRRGSRQTIHSTLQQIDYSFYRRLEDAGEEITEEFLWGRLEPLLHYLPSDQVAKVQEALSLAYDAHAGQVRKSGEKYITHPVEVARILAELQMDGESLAAGLLHDTVEDTQEVSFEEIETWFGPGVRSIVEGETRFSKIGNYNEASPEEPIDLKALDLQQLFLAMTEEVRIIIVKLADRLHNMRTLDSMPPHKQKKIADETLQVFAPLARLLGLYSIKEELEALSFKHSQPEAHQAIVERLNTLRAQQLPAVDAACRRLEAVLQGDAYLQQRLCRVTVEAHSKALYSLHKKCVAKGIEVKDLRDVAQLRVVLHPHTGAGSAPWPGTDDKQLCYHVMGLVHTVWAPIPGCVKDYIATPKPNGYQSLHTTVLPLGAADNLFPLEVHIRTGEMHRLAQYGIACERWVAKFRSSGSAVEAPAPLPKSPTESELAPIDSRDGEAAELAPGQRQSPAAAPVRDPELIRGPLNGTKLNGAPKNSALNGVKINGAHVRSAVDAAMELPDVGGKLPAPDRSPAEVASGTGGSSSQLTRLDQQVMARRVNWLTSIREWQAEFLNTMPPREFVDCITDDLLGQGVFVFTPSGAPMRLPKGATVVDFAYHVHTDVGNHMKAAKVNGKPVHSDYALKNAEVVEIILDGKEVTVQDVLRHQRWRPTTRSARHKLAKFVKDYEHLLHLDPTSPEGRMMSHGILQRVLEWGVPPPPPARRESWLLVRCSDRAGLLADVANIISTHSHNILEYKGSGSSGGGSADSWMLFVVEGDPSQQADMVATIEVTPTVSSVEAGLGRPDSPVPGTASATVASMPTSSSADSHAFQSSPATSSSATTGDFGASNGSTPAASTSASGPPTAAVQGQTHQWQQQQQQLWPVGPHQRDSSGNGCGPTASSNASGNGSGPAAAGSESDGQPPTASAASWQDAGPYGGGGAFTPQQPQQQHQQERAPPHPPLAWAGTVGAGGAAWGVPLQGAPEEQRGPQEGRRRREQQHRQASGTYNWWRPPFG